MSNAMQDLEVLREHFLDQLHTSHVSLKGHDALLGYWQLVEKQADASGNLELLERGVRELARDQGRLQALEARVEREDQDTGMLAPVLEVIRMLLDALTQLGRRLGRMRNARRGQVAAILWAAGPGALVQVKPENKDEKKREGEGEDDEQAALLAQRQPEKPLVQTPPEKQKKFER